MKNLMRGRSLEVASVCDLLLNLDRELGSICSASLEFSQARLSNTDCCTSRRVNRDNVGMRARDKCGWRVALKAPRRSNAMPECLAPDSARYT